MSVQNELITKQDQTTALARQFQVQTPLVDIYENEDEIVLQADMPGVVREDLSIEINDGKLYLAGSRQLESSGAPRWRELASATFKRTFSVPPTIEAGKVSARLVNGVLQLRLPKSESAKPRQIEVEAG